MSDPIKFDVGGWDSSADDAWSDCRPMNYAVYQDGKIIALCRTAIDAEALMELLEAKYGANRLCCVDCGHVTAQHLCRCHA